MKIRVVVDEMRNDLLKMGYIINYPYHINNYNKILITTNKGLYHLMDLLDKEIFVYYKKYIKYLSGENLSGAGKNNRPQLKITFYTDLELRKEKLKRII